MAYHRAGWTRILKEGMSNPADRRAMTCAWVPCFLALAYQQGSGATPEPGLSTLERRLLMVAHVGFGHHVYSGYLEWILTLT